jgi:hypothetical protein
MGVLQGTFDTLSLTEVLGLLAQSQKTGALWVEAGSVQGRVYLADGRCCAAESGDVTGPVDSDSELSTRLIDVCFSLVRQQEGGSFRFVVDEVPSWPAPSSVPVDEAVSSLERLLGEWREIQAVIPSLDSRPRLSPELGTDSIILDAARWRLVVALDGRRSVREVIHETERSVLDVCNALKELIDEGAVELAPPISETVLNSALQHYTSHAPDDAPDAPDAHAEPHAEMATPASAEDDDATMPADAGAPAAVEMPDPFAGTNDTHDVTAESSVPDAVAVAPAFDAPEVPDSFDAPAPVDMPAPPEVPMAPIATPVADFPDQPAEAPAPPAAAVAPEQPMAAAPAGLDETDPRDRGALLRLFSALRDT